MRLNIRLRWSRSGLEANSACSASRPSFISAYNAGNRMNFMMISRKVCRTIPSVDAFTATNLSKFSSTNTLIASDRESREDRKWEIPEVRSWYVAFGCTTERKVLGLNDLEERRMVDSAH